MYHYTELSRNHDDLRAFSAYCLLDVRQDIFSVDCEWKIRGNFDCENFRDTIVMRGMLIVRKYMAVYQAR